jgi:hypothetical protein
MENRLVSTGKKPNYRRLTGWKERTDELKAKEEKLAKLDAKMAASHRQMVAKIIPETPEQTMACQEMEEAESEETQSCEVFKEREHREKENEHAENLEVSKVTQEKEEDQNEEKVVPIF